ncbi:uncharacterized protein LOC144239255 [Crocuta crocuta]
MELSRHSVRETRKRTGLGRCRHFFWLGVAFDTAGATVLLTGVFAHLVFSDMLLYLGSIIIFLSLLWWVFWYTGNIELPAEEASKRPFHVLSSTLVEALSQTVSHRFSLTICNMSGRLRRFRRRCSRRRFLRKAASLDLTVTGQLHNRPKKEEQDKDAAKGVREGGDAQDLRGEDLGPEPKPVGSSEGVGPPGPDAGLPGFAEGSSSTHLVPPDFVASPPDQPRAPPAVLPYRSLHVVPLTPACPPLAAPSSGSQPAGTLASAGQPAASQASSSQPAIILAPESLPAVPSASMSQPALVLDSQGQPLVPASAQSNLQALVKASLSCPLVSASTHSRLQAPLASRSQLENASLDPQTPSPGACAAQVQALSAPVFLIQLLSPQPLQSQTVALQPSPGVLHFQTLCHTQQVPQSIVSLAQEVTPSQPASGQESQKPVAQSSATPSPASQELSQEPTTTASPPPGSLAPQSPENTPVPASEKRSHPP